MQTNSLSLKQKAHLALVQGKMLDYQLSKQGLPEDVPAMWQKLVDKTVERGEDEQAVKLVTHSYEAMTIRDGSGDKNRSFVCLLNPHIRSKVNQSLLGCLAAGPITSWQAALAKVVVEVAGDLPSLSTGDDVDEKQHLLESTMRVFRDDQDPACEFLVTNSSKLIAERPFGFNAETKKASEAQKLGIILGTLDAIQFGMEGLPS